MKTALEITRVADVQISVAADAEKRKAELLTELEGYGIIEDDFSRDGALDALMNAKEFVRLVEKSRVEVKAPVLDLTRAIDGRAKELTDKVNDAIARLNQRVTAYALAQRRKAEEVERARKAEIARREEEQRRLAAEQAALEAKRAEAAAAAEAPFTPSEAEEAQAALAQIDTKAAAIAQEAAKVEQAKAAVIQAPLPPAPLPTEKAAIRTRKNFRVVDIHALYAARRDLVRMEADRRAVLDAISGGMAECPGIEIFEEHSTRLK
jgi:hypothetical protein